MLNKRRRRKCVRVNIYAFYISLRTKVFLQQSEYKLHFYLSDCIHFDGHSIIENSKLKHCECAWITKLGSKIRHFVKLNFKRLPPLSYGNVSLNLSLEVFAQTFSIKHRNKFVGYKICFKFYKLTPAPTMHDLKLDIMNKFARSISNYCWSVFNFRVIPVCPHEGNNRN